MRVDLWWLCRDMKLRPRFPSAWHGSCTLTQILMPFHLFPSREFRNLGSKLHPSYLQCYKRSRAPGGSFDRSVYVDSIGVPRGVPDEFKARNQVEAGFDAIKGIAEQLGPTSLMAWQNIMALDVLLCEKGGVCKMFGTICCTSYPTTPP